MKNLYGCCLILLLAFGCQGIEVIDPEIKKLSACGTADLLSLPWLSEVIQYEGDYCTVYQIAEGTYQGETVFITNVSGALCCTCAGSAVYNCQGELVFVCDTDKLEDVRNLKIIWERK